MGNINKSPNHVAHLGRTGHDMSQTLKFTSSVGHLLPVYYDILNPNETVTIDAELISKTVRPLKSPALTQIDEYLDWFFVPMTCLYSLFEQVYYHIDDVHSSMYDADAVLEDFPIIDGNTFMEEFANPYVLSLGSPSDQGFIPALDNGTWLDTNGQARFDQFGVPVIQNTYRLAQLFGLSTRWFYDDDVSLQPPTGPVSQKGFSVFLPAAYQAIYYSYYRLTDWENNNASAYNFDDCYSSPNSADGHLDHLFDMHYRPLKKDFFTNLLPKPLVSRDSVGILDDAQFRESFVNDPKASYVDSGTPTSYGSYQDMSVNPNFGNTVALGTAKLRGMFALEKLLEITRRAGKHVDDQVLAHFGVKTSDHKTGEVVHIGSTSVIMDVSQLQATATSENQAGSSVLGEYAGNLSSHLRQNKFTFNTHGDHGILMCIYSAVPRADYSSHAVFDKFNTIEGTKDLYYPEFDNLGMYPQFCYQLDFYVAGEYADRDHNDQLLGWQYRYQEYKQKYNRVAGGLLFDLNYWTTMRNGYQIPDYNAQVLDPYSPYRFYCSPKMLNPLVSVSFPYDHRDGSFNVQDPNEDQSEVKQDFTYLPNAFVSDPLVHFIAFDVKKVSTMSTYSLPKL